MRFFLYILLALAAVIGNPRAEEWPARPVRMIVPYPAGGSTDNSARAFADKLAAMLGQPFVIENKGGAGGTIGLEAGAKAQPDGYNFVVVPAATVTVLPHGRKVPYDPFRDFAYVGRFTIGTLTFAIIPSLPVSDMREFIAHAKANPGRLTYASSGIGAMPHIAFEVLKQTADIDVLHVPYRGGAEAIGDFLGGHVHAIGESNILPHVKAGKAKLLALADSERHPDFPDVPILSEILPEYDVVNWFGLAAPAGTDPKIVARMGAAMNEVAEMPDIRDKLLPFGLRPATDTPEAMTEAVSAQSKRYGDLIRGLGIQFE